jgi:hypothetical protein
MNKTLGVIIGTFLLIESLCGLEALTKKEEIDMTPNMPYNQEIIKKESLDYSNKAVSLKALGITCWKGKARSYCSDGEDTIIVDIPPQHKIPFLGKFRLDKGIYVQIIKENDTLFNYLEKNIKDPLDTMKTKIHKKLVEPYIVIAELEKANTREKLQKIVNGPLFKPSQAYASNNIIDLTFSLSYEPNPQIEIKNSLIRDPLYMKFNTNGDSIKFIGYFIKPMFFTSVKALIK